MNARSSEEAAYKWRSATASCRVVTEWWVFFLGSGRQGAPRRSNAVSNADELPSRPTGPRRCSMPVGATERMPQIVRQLCMCRVRLRYMAAWSIAVVITTAHASCRHPQPVSGSRRALVVCISILINVNFGSFLIFLTPLRQTCLIAVGRVGVAHGEHNKRIHS
eukprot:scaffold142828_cov37-Tisochrysis_lutea.AAC.1